MRKSGACVSKHHSVVSKKRCLRETHATAVLCGIAPCAKTVRMQEVSELANLCHEQQVTKIL